MEQKSGLIGIYEKANAASVWDDGTPWEFENELFEPDYDRIMPWLENALERMPVLADKGIKSVVHGAITHPPDGNMLLGPSGIKKFLAAVAARRSASPGDRAPASILRSGWCMAPPTCRCADFDPRRFGARIDDDYRINKAKEDYLLRHEIPYPHLDRPDAAAVALEVVTPVPGAEGARVRSTKTCTVGNVLTGMPIERRRAKTHRELSAAVRCSTSSATRYAACAAHAGYCRSHRLCQNRESAASRCRVFSGSNPVQQGCHKMIGSLSR